MEFRFLVTLFNDAYSKLNYFIQLIVQVNITSDGKILLSINPSIPGKSGIKFLLLNPAASHFGDLVSQCRAVVVAGGTMQPVEEFKEQLFLAAGGQPGMISL